VQTAQPEAASDQWTLIRNARQVITLSGPTGLRRGPGMNELNIIPNGAVLIRNDQIEEAGPGSRLENLRPARRATVIDASRKIVMPAFVDTDFPLVCPDPSAGKDASWYEDGSALRRTSRKKMLESAGRVAADCAYYGCLTLGAHTAYATDLPNAKRVLRTYTKTKLLRIRSILSIPELSSGGQSALRALISKWLPAIRRDKLASMVEFSFPGEEHPDELSMAREAAAAAAELGFAIRLRSARRPNPALLQLAVSVGAVAIIAPNDGLRAFVAPLADLGCVRILSASGSYNDDRHEVSCLRMALTEGAAVAIASGYRPHQPASFNMQFLLHLAVYRFGLTPEEAITATTYNSACSLRLSRDTGSIERGKKADLIVLDVPDYHELPRRAGHHDVDVVMRAGQILYRRSH
jgi:imidazolonepropionase